MVFNWSLSDSKSPQVSRTLLSILAVLNNALIWMVSTRPPTSKSSSPFSNPFVTVPNIPITIGIIITCMFHSFFNSLARSRYLSFFSHSFSFILWSAGTAKSTILQVLFSFSFFFFFCLSSSLVHLRKGLEYLTRCTAQVFIPLIRFLLLSFVSSSFLVLLRYSFWIFSFNWYYYYYYYHFKI